MRSIPLTTLTLCVLFGALARAHAGTVPAAPPGTSATTVSVTSPLAVLILDEQSNPSSLQVTGLQGEVWDVNVLTNITHEHTGDLWVTLTAPSGTVATLSTNNNVPMLGVTFDDSAPTPIALATGPAPSFAPEGALSVLMGEDPNGTWVLDCEDKQPAFTGAFTWTIEITTVDATLARTTRTFSSTEALDVPTLDSREAVIDVATPGFVCDVDVHAHVYAVRPEDLELRLVNAGLESFLAEGLLGASDTFANVRFDDSAPLLVTHAPSPSGRLGDVVPAGALGRMVGSELAQPWRFVVTNLGNDTVTILGWDLVVTTCEVETAVQSLCSGAAPAPCPCGNQGSADGGCANALHPGGARLTAEVAPDGPRLGDGTRLVARDLEPFQLCLFVQGTQAIAGGLGTPLGDGLLCAGGSVVRLGARLTGLGSTSYPGLFDAPLSTRGLLPPTGGTRIYQVIQRSSLVLGPCHSGLNSTNAVRIGWAP